MELEKLNISHNLISSVNGFSEYSLLHISCVVKLLITSHMCRLHKGKAGFVIMFKK